MLGSWQLVNGRKKVENPILDVLTQDCVLKGLDPLLLYIVKNF